MPPLQCPSWPPITSSASRSGYLLVVAYGGINQQLSQVSDALVLGGALNANVVVPELLVHHVWRDPARLSELIDVPHWKLSAAARGVNVVDPEELTGNASAVYERCGRKGPLPNAGRVSSSCGPYHVSLIRGGTIDAAVSQIRPKLSEHGFVTVTTLSRLHTPVKDPTRRMQHRLAFVHAHYVALRQSPAIRTAVSLLSGLPTRFVSLHLRQEIDTLAISGCICKDDPRYEQSERIIARWGGWGSDSLRGAVEQRAKFGNSTSAMRKAGKCGVDAASIVKVLRALVPGAGRSVACVAPPHPSSLNRSTACHAPPSPWLAERLMRRSTKEAPPSHLEAPSTSVASSRVWSRSRVPATRSTPNEMCWHQRQWQCGRITPACERSLTWPSRRVPIFSSPHRETLTERCEACVICMVARQ